MNASHKSIRERIGQKSGSGGGMEQNPADVALRSREDGYRGLAPSDPTAHRSLAPEAIAADESWTGAASSASGIVYWLRFGCEGPT